MHRNYGRIEAQRLKLPISGWGHHKSTVRGCLCGHLHPRLFLKFHGKLLEPENISEMEKEESIKISWRASLVAPW